MAIGPEGLNGVTAYRGDAPQLERLRRERAVRIFVNIAHDIHLAFAAGARAASAQFFQVDKALRAVVPFDGELLANGLDVNWSH